MTPPIVVRVLFRAIRRWYDPAAAAERERRTAEARTRAIAIRVRSEAVERRVAATRRSYEQSSARMKRSNGGHA